MTQNTGPSYGKKWTSARKWVSAHECWAFCLFLAVVACGLVAAFVPLWSSYDNRCGEGFALVDSVPLDGGGCSW